MKFHLWKLDLVCLTERQEVLPSVCWHRLMDCRSNSVNSVQAFSLCRVPGVGSTEGVSMCAQATRFSRNNFRISKLNLTLMVFRRLLCGFVLQPVSKPPPPPPRGRKAGKDSTSATGNFFCANVPFGSPPGQSVLAVSPQPRVVSAHFASPPPLFPPLVSVSLFAVNSYCFFGDEFKLWELMGTSISQPVWI